MTTHVLVRRAARAPAYCLFCTCLLAACTEEGADAPATMEPEPAPVTPEPSPEPASTPEPSVRPAEPEMTEPEMIEPEGAEPDVPEPDVPEPNTPPGPENAPDGGDPVEPESAPDAGPVMVRGVCGLRGQGTVDTESFEGYEERYIIGDEGFGVDVCVVRLELEHVGAAPAGCVDLSDEPCLWAHEIEIVGAEVLLDEGGACANSDLGLDDAALATLPGTREAYGFVEEYVGHNSVFLAYDAGNGTWIPSGNANWDEETGAFRFDRRDGNCNYLGASE